MRLIGGFVAVRVAVVEFEKQTIVAVNERAGVKHLYLDDLVFFDGNKAVGNGGYGDAIRIAPDGEPLVKIEGGKILSSYEMCSCEQKYQYGQSGLIRVRSKEEHDEFRRSLTDSGEFTEIRQGTPAREGLIRTVKGVTWQYKCTRCGAVWDLPAYVKVKDKQMAGLPAVYKLSRIVYISLNEDKEKRT